MYMYSIGQSQFRNEQNVLRGKADDEISVVVLCVSERSERALQKHIHFRVSKADISVWSHILATNWQLLFSRSVASVRSHCTGGVEIPALRPLHDCIYRGKALPF